MVAAVAVALGALCLRAVLTGNHWYAPVLLVVVVVAAVGAGCRWVRIPLVVAVPAQLAGVLLTCTGLYAHRHAFAGFVPTPAALSALGNLVSAGGSDLRTVLFPAYARTDLALLGVGAVGVVATLVDVLAVTVRRPTLAGLPLVLLVAVPAAIRERSVGYLDLLAAVVGFLMLLSLDAGERTGRWGRVLPNPRATLPSAAAGSVAPALQIGLTSLALAVLVPLAIPGASTSPFGSGPGFDGGGSGPASAQIVDPLVSVSAEIKDSSDQLLLTVQSPTATYLRLTALEDFTDAGFTLGPISAPTSARVSKGLAPPTGVTQATASRSVSETITAADSLAEKLLPVPEGTRSVRVSGDWRLSQQTRTIFSSHDTTRGSTWTVQADLPQPSPGLLLAGGAIGQHASAFPTNIGVDLQLPSDLPALVGQTATAWIGGATSTYAAALAIQQHFTDGAFRYDTTVSFNPGPQGFSDFLAARTGFCEQYATTMVAMLRTLGVPARVAIGFTGGTAGSPGTYVVTGADAHAWPEVWFSNVGWVRFEPTPRSDGLATAPAYATGQTTPGGVTGPGASASTAPQPSASASRDPRAAKLDHQPGDVASGGAGRLLSARGNGVPVALWVLVGVALLGAALALPGCLAAVRRRRRLSARGRGSVEGVWGQLLDDAADRGVRVAAGASPRATGRQIQRALPRDAAAGSAVAALVGAVEQARYAPGGEGHAGADLAAHERVVRRALGGELPRGRRALVWLSPASGRAGVRGPLTAAVPAMLGAADRLVGRRRSGPAPG